MKQKNKKTKELEELREAYDIAMGEINKYLELKKKIINFKKYMKRQSFHAYVKQKMVKRFDELFKEGMEDLK